MLVAAVTGSTDILWDAQRLLMFTLGRSLEVQAGRTMTAFTLFIDHTWSLLDTGKSSWFSVSRGMTGKTARVIIFFPHLYDPKIF
jgi:hypothetical protein